MKASKVVEAILASKVQVEKLQQRVFGVHIPTYLVTKLIR
jgi:hypothetical protein